MKKEVIIQTVTGDELTCDFIDEHYLGESCNPSLISDCFPQELGCILIEYTEALLYLCCVQRCLCIDCSPVTLCRCV